VREHQPNSHAKKGWEQFTDAVITSISQKKSGLVFLLWGNSAQSKIRYSYVTTGTGRLGTLSWSAVHKA
jgi:uracil DNA glycosylase